MSLSPKSALAHYTIISKLGAGGMGEVYLAQDTKLDRNVALKILPADLAANQDRMRRFVQEAKAAAALNHPNIATIHEIGESDGVNFIAMEFIDGVTLREKIHQERTDLRKLFRFLQHAAEGLATAHAAGIVHRDLKPDNIMISRDGHAKILDFGLAKLIEQQPMSVGDSGEAATAVMQQHSTPGVIMGTVGYMSPEQAQGKTNEIDQRSDIFSFGCILFEAATGHKAFAGKDLLDSLHKIVHAPTPQISEINANAPAELQRIVRRCLAKDPDERYQSIKEVAIELKELRRELPGAGIDTTVTPPSRIETMTSTGGEGTRSQSLSPTIGTPSLSQQGSSAEYLVSQVKEYKKSVLVGLALLVLVIAGVAFGIYKFAGRKETGSIRSIAVLPFQNKSGDPNSEYLSDGLAESLIYRLSQLPDLKVSPTSSVIRYKGKDTEVSKIASELGVEAVMTGRLSQIGDNLTISVELVDVRNNKLLWGERYERKMSELLATQREIATTITQKLQLKLSGEEPGLTKKYTDNNEAYQLYLKGRFSWNKRTSESLKQSVDFYNQSIAKDPGFALAYSGLAETYVLFPNYLAGTPKESLPLSKAAALRALELDDSLAEAHAAYGRYLNDFEFDFPRGEKEFRRAIELNPKYATAHSWLGGILSYQKRFDEAVAETRMARDLDPLSLISSAEIGNSLIYARRYDEAIAQLNETLKLDPNFFTARFYLGRAYLYKGMYQEAIAEFRKATTPADRRRVMGHLAIALIRSGQRAEAMEILNQLKTEEASGDVRPFPISQVYAALGDKEEALAWMERTIDSRSQFSYSFAITPEFDELRGDPRFKAILKRANLPE